MANWFIGLPVLAGSWLGALAPPPGLRLFHPDDLHITVAFLGAVGEEAAQRAFALAPGWPTPCLRVILGKLVALGNPRRFSALSATLVEGHDAVAQGIDLVRHGMADAAGARRDERAALPHVTVGRPSRNADTRTRKDILAWAESVDLGAPRVAITSLCLYTRASTPGGPSYQVIARHELAAN